MSDAPPSLVHQLRLCIVRSPAGPWPALLTLLQRLIDSAFRSVAPVHLRDLIEEFREWLPGWLITGQRLESAHTWLDETVRSGGCQAAADQERALRNYLYKTIHSGAGDFFRERVGRSEASRAVRRLSQDDENEQVAKSERLSAPDHESLMQVRECLAVLPLPLRVPFWLRFYEACGPLMSDELLWVSEQSGFAPEIVTRTIEDELREHIGAECPLSAEFIGQLLQISPAADGRFVTVNQRVCRARQLLRDHLAPRDDEP